MSNKIYIYKIYFPTSKKCYIGLTKYLNERLCSHLESKHLVGRALRKYDDWQISILHIIKDREQAKLIEIEEIRNCGSIHPKGYNQTRGGDGLAGYWKGRKRSEENNEKNRQARIGKKLTEEHKANIGKASKKYHNKPEVKKKTAEFMRERMKGNSYGKGYKHSKEWVDNLIKRNKENNPMKNSVVVLKKRYTQIKNNLANLEKVGD